MTHDEIKSLCDEADALQQIWQYPREPHTSADVSALTRSGLYLSFKLTAALREAVAEIERLRIKAGELTSAERYQQDFIDGTLDRQQDNA